MNISITSSVFKTRTRWKFSFKHQQNFIFATFVFYVCFQCKYLSLMSGNYFCSFKHLLVKEKPSSWAIGSSNYHHLNPIRVVHMHHNRRIESDSFNAVSGSRHGNLITTIARRWSALLVKGPFQIDVYAREDDRLLESGRTPIIIIIAAFLRVHVLQMSQQQVLIISRRWAHGKNACLFAVSTTFCWEVRFVAPLGRLGKSRTADHVWQLMMKEGVK